MRQLVDNAVALVACVVAATGLAACSDAQRDPVADTGSLSAEGVLVCAEQAAVGTVSKVTAGSGGLTVAFTVDRWVVPSSGPAEITFDVAGQQAGVWQADRRGMVVTNRISDDHQWFDEQAAEELTSSWEGTNAPSSPACEETSVK